MFSLEVTIDPSPLVAALGKIPAALDFRHEPLKGAADKASAALLRWEHNRFVTFSGGGGSWPDLSPVTKERRLKKQAKAAGVHVSRRDLARAVASTTLPMLYVTGALEAGLFDRGATGHFVEFSEDAVSEGVRDGQHPEAPISIGQLAFIHHFGSPSRHIPARPVMGTPDEDIVFQVGGILGEGVSAAFSNLASELSGPLSPAA